MPTGRVAAAEPAGTGDLHRQPLRGPTPPGGGNRVPPDALAPSDGRGGAGTRAGSAPPQWQARFPRLRGPRQRPGSGYGSRQGSIRGTKTILPWPSMPFWITLTVVSGQRHCARVCVCGIRRSHALATWRSGRARQRGDRRTVRTLHPSYGSQPSCVQWPSMRSWPVVNASLAVRGGLWRL